MVEDDARFCTNCGNPLYNVCPKCGAHTEAIDKFCGQCGVSLTSLSQVEVTEVANPVGESLVATEEQISRTEDSSTPPDSLPKEKADPSDKKSSTHNTALIIAFVATIVLLGFMIITMLYSRGHNISHSYEYADTCSCTDEEAYLGTSPEKDIIINFITDMYNNDRYFEDEFLYQHCSQKLIRKLKANYDYPGEGLAFWLFRTNAQEVKDLYDQESKIISVTADEDGWFSYSFLDMGWKGLNRMKAHIENDNVIIDDVVQVEMESE